MRSRRRRAEIEPPDDAPSGRLAKAAGIFGMVVGFCIVIGTATGRLKATGDPSLGYMVGGVTVGYGLLRFLRGRMDGRHNR